MPLEPLATGILETALNALLKDDPAYGRRLARLRGQVLQLHLQELKQTLTFTFSNQVDVLSNYEGEPDCWLSLSLSVLPEFRQQPDITRLIKEDKLQLKGDHQLAQQFAQLMVDCKPDIEEWVSRVTGDAVAHILVQGIKDTGCRLKRQMQRKQRHLAQVLTEEWKIAPPPLEVAHFCDQVDDLRKEVELAEHKLQQLAEKI